jgi:hypothetical protein
MRWRAQSCLIAIRVASSPLSSLADDRRQAPLHNQVIHWIYDATWFIDRVARNDLQIIEIWGGWDRRAYDERAERLIVVAGREGTNAAFPPNPKAAVHN